MFFLCLCRVIIISSEQLDSLMTPEIESLLTIIQSRTLPRVVSPTTLTLAPPRNPPVALKHVKREESASDLHEVSSEDEELPTRILKLKKIPPLVVRIQLVERGNFQLLVKESDESSKTVFGLIKRQIPPPAKLVRRRRKPQKLEQGETYIHDFNKVTSTSSHCECVLLSAFFPLHLQGDLSRDVLKAHFIKEEYLDQVTFIGLQRDLKSSSSYSRETKGLFIDVVNFKNGVINKDSLPAGVLEHDQLYVLVYESERTRLKESLGWVRTQQFKEVGVLPFFLSASF